MRDLAVIASRGIKWIRAGIALALVMMLAACAPLYSPPPPIHAPPSAPLPPGQTYPDYTPDAPVRPDGTHEQKRAPTYKVAPSEISPGSAGKAVESLLEEAWGHYRNDDFERAIVVAERAQRLDPRAAEVYLVLASAYLGQGKDQLAGQFARRGINYSAAGSVLRQRLQAVLVSLSP